MKKIQVNQTIEAPTEKVWETFLSFEKPEHFVPIIKISHIQRNGDSTLRNCTVQLGDQEGKIVEKLQKVDDQGKVLVFSIEEAPEPFAGLQTRYQVASLSDESTEVNISTELANGTSQVVTAIQGIFEMAEKASKNYMKKRR